jgi:hypothetical protein
VLCKCSFGVEFFGASGTVEVVGVKRLFALRVGIALWLEVRKDNVLFVRWLQKV